MSNGTKSLTLKIIGQIPQETKIFYNEQFSQENIQW